MVYYCHIGSKDFFFIFFSSVRCLPSFDLSYFCCVPRGMNSPSINISIVISAGRPKVTFRKMSWNWFLTFISQSGWGLFLARRVFTHPTHETILKLKGYSVSAQGLAQFFLWLGSIPRQKAVCEVSYFLRSLNFSPTTGTFGWLRDGDKLQVLTPMQGGGSRGVPCPTSWAFCHVGDLLLILFLQERLWRADLSDAGVRMWQRWRLRVPNPPMWHSWSSLLSLSVPSWLVRSLQCLRGSDAVPVDALPHPYCTYLFKLVPSSDPFLCLDKSWCLSQDHL